MDPALTRVIEKFRRVARTNVATKDIAQSLLDELEAAGFSLVATPPAVEAVNSDRSLLLRRAERMERDGETLHGLRLRLQAIGG